MANEPTATTELTWTAADEADTARLGAALSSVLPDGTVIALCGTLGAGKTRLVQALCAAEGVHPETVMSPTFVLVHEYAGRRPIYHFDAYRLTDTDEFWNLGPDEYFQSRGISLVEWADRVAECMPSRRLEIEIAVTGSTSRQFTIRGIGPGWEEFFATLRGQLK